MKSRVHTSLVFTSLLLIFVAVILVMGLRLPKEIGLPPLFVGVPTLILLIILWLGELIPRWKFWVPKAQRTAGGTSKKEEASDFTGWGPVVNIIGWLFGFFVIIFLFGFYVATPIFLAAFLIRKARMHWAWSALIAVATTAAACSVVQYSFEIRLWLGALPKIIPGYVGGSIIPPI